MPGELIFNVWRPIVEKPAELIASSGGRKVVGEPLRESEESYRVIFDHSPVGISIARHGVTLLSNDAALHMFGYDDSSEMVETTQLSRIAPDCRHEISEYIAKRERGESAPKAYETDGRRKDGSIFPIHIEVARIDLPEGPASVAFFTDITERKRVEDALRESEQRFRTVFEQAVVGMAEIESKSGRFIRVNQRYCDIVGYTPQEMLASTFQAITHPDDLHADLDNMALLLTGRIREFSMEKRCLRKDGGIVWVDLSVSPMWNPGDEPTCHIAVVQEITERKRAQEALQTAHQQLQDIIEFLPDATFVIDRDKKVIAWNLAMQEMTGVEKKDILGRTQYAYAVPFYGEERPILIDLVMDDAADGDQQYALIERKGSTIYGEAFVPMNYRGKASYVWAKASPLLDFAGQKSGAIESIRDITDLKRTEEQLGRYRNHLEELVKERTTELSNANEQLLRLIEEHRRAEEELREREEFLTTIVENIPDMIFVKDAKELRFVRFNRAGENLLGSSRQDLIGKNDYDLFPRNEAEFFTAKDREVLSRRRLLDIPEETILTKHWGQRILHTKKIPISDSEGNPRYLLGISEDITVRKHAEEALQASEQRYKQLLSSATDYIFTIAIKDGLPVSTTHGQGCVAVTGYSSKDYAGMPFLWYEMVHLEDQESVKQHAEAALRGELREPLEHRIIHKNGTTRWVRNTMVPRSDHTGRLIACDGLVSDITERKIIERELQQTNAYLENIFENSPDAIGIVDASGRFIKWNRMAAQLYGYTFEEMKGKSGFDLYADKDELQRMQRPLREEGSVRKWEMRMKRKDGSIVPFEISIGLLKSSQNKTLGSVAVARNLSRIKEALVALQVSNEQLNREIAERRRAEEALLKSEETLQQSEKNLRSLTSQLFTIQEADLKRAP